MPGAYALAKSGSDYTLAGVTLSQSGSIYSSGSGETNGMKVNIADTNIQMSQKQKKIIQQTNIKKKNRRRTKKKKKK